MSNVIVCYKWVLDEAEIKVNGDLSVDFSKAKAKLNDYDRNGIEAGVQAAKVLGGKAYGMTLCGAGGKASIKPALARGLDEGIWANVEEAADADSAVTAKALAKAVAKTEDIGLVICSEGASDTYARQIPSKIGAYLDWPVITAVQSMEINGNELIAVRRLDDCMQTVKVTLPAVVSVMPEIANAPIPNLKAIMAAGKKPVTQYSAADLDMDFTPKAAKIGVRGYVMNRKNIILKDGEAADKVAQLAAALRKEGVV